LCGPGNAVSAGRSDTLERTRLVERRPELKDELIREIRRAIGPGGMRRLGGQRTDRDGRQRREGVAAMLERAGDAIETLRIRTVPDQDPGEPSVHLWVLIGDLQSISSAIPDDAREKNGPAIELMLEFHEELSFVFPDYKTLGGYVPRPIKDQIPPGWENRRPVAPVRRGPAFASEHAWGDADDAARSNGHAGFDQGPSLKPLLGRITEYTLANRGRLKLVHHIIDGHQFRRSDDFEKTVYTGSDPHDTHTHSAFGEHDGRKPPWLP
jgi:hypothetical protein